MEYTNKKFSRILGGSLFLMLMSSVILSVALAANRLTVCIFCADWSAKCRQATSDIQSVVSSYSDKVYVEEFNIDLSSTPSRARSLGVDVPAKIPYVVVVDKSKNVVFQQQYTSQTSQQLRAFLDSKVR